MTTIEVLDSKFTKKGSIETPVELGADAINVPVVHQVVKATLAGRRQGTACTKNRALVRGGGAKPFKQKGTGRARQGSTRSPLMPGGGTVFGPTPRDYTQKVNKKMAKKAIQAIIADKLQAGKLIVVETIESTGKTKDMAATFAARGIGSCLVVTTEASSLALRAARNIRNAKGIAAEGFSVYEAVKYETLLIEEKALTSILEKIGA